MKISSLPAQFVGATETLEEGGNFFILRATCGCVAARSYHDHPEEWCAYRGYARCVEHGGGAVNLRGEEAPTPSNIGGGMMTAGIQFPKELMPTN